jgi:hypothetical protein
LPCCLCRHYYFFAFDLYDYQVAKLTYTYQQWGDKDPMRVELQGNTMLDRLHARIGSSAHASYRLTGVSGSIPQHYTDLMGALNQDRFHIGDLALSPQSGLRSDDLLAKIGRLAA